MKFTSAFYLLSVLLGFVICGPGLQGQGPPAASPQASSTTPKVPAAPPTRPGWEYCHLMEGNVSGQKNRLVSFDRLATQVDGKWMVTSGTCRGGWHELAVRLDVCKRELGSHPDVSYRGNVLDAVGQQGWELVGMAGDLDGRLVWAFKRPCAAAP